MKKTKWMYVKTSDMANMPESFHVYNQMYETVCFVRDEKNARLIAAAPQLLARLEQIYLDLQTAVQKELMDGHVSLALQTDSIRASLRNDISEITGEGCRELQERIEEAAFKKAKGL